MSDAVNECVIEWIKGEKVATVTMPSHTRLNNKIRKLASSTMAVTYVENKDGSIVAHVPSNWIKITAPRQLSESQKEALSDRMKAMHNEKRSGVIPMMVIERSE